MLIEITWENNARDISVSVYKSDSIIETLESEPIETDNILKMEQGHFKSFTTVSNDPVNGLRVENFHWIFTWLLRSNSFFNWEPWELPAKTKEALDSYYGESENYPEKIKELKKQVEESNINQTAILAWQ